MKSVLKLIKNKAKSNVTYSISRFEDQSFRSLNLTGKLVSCEGFISSEGQDYSNELIGIDCATTVVITNQAQAEAILERLQSIFDSRNLSADSNPAVDLLIESNSIRPTSTNIIITNVSKIFVESNTSLANSTDNIIESLAALKSFSAAKSTLTSNAQLNAAKIGLSSALSSIQKSVKSYF